MTVLTTRRPCRPFPVAAPAAPDEAARSAGLRYVTDRQAGIRRLRRGRGFVYLDPDGHRVRDAATLARIRGLAIPPAWTHVWICPRPDGHLQATGRDDRGRKQCRYHPRWRQIRDEAKYDRLVAFGLVLRALRARVEQDLARPGLSRPKVLATVVRLLETTLIRVGNAEYARANRSYGLTTIRNHHVLVEGPTVAFGFRGKSGVYHSVDVRDPRLARVVKKCQELPGQELFEYLDDDRTPRDVTSADVNDYVREVTGADFTAKDFRTWAGTVLAARALRRVSRQRPEDTAPSPTRLKREAAGVIKEVARRLGNTPAVCRACYVHPAVLDAHLDGTLADSLQPPVARPEGLDADEAAVLAFLQARAATSSPPPAETSD